MLSRRRHLVLRNSVLQEPCIPEAFSVHGQARMPVMRVLVSNLEREIFGGVTERLADSVKQIGRDLVRTCSTSRSQSSEEEGLTDVSTARA